MKQYWVDFKTIRVEAASEEDAREKAIIEIRNSPYSSIDSVEEVS